MSLEIVKIVLGQAISLGILRIKFEEKKRDKTLSQVLRVPTFILAPEFVQIGVRALLWKRIEYIMSSCLTLDLFCFLSSPPKSILFMNLFTNCPSWLYS